MDGCDFYDYFVQPLEALDASVLMKVADVALDEDWIFTQQGQQDVIDKCADEIYTQYMDTGACESMGPATFVNHYLNGANYGIRKS